MHFPSKFFSVSLTTKRQFHADELESIITLSLIITETNEREMQIQMVLGLIA